MSPFNSEHMFPFTLYVNVVFGIKTLILSGVLYIYAGLGGTAESMAGL